MTANRQKTEWRGPGGGLFYGLGFIGALVYYLQQAHGFGQLILAILRALVWPALLVYHLLGFIS